MSLDEYLLSLHGRQLALLYQCMLANDIRGALHLLAWSDIRTCVNPGWHRQYWKHAGEQYYVCEVCERMIAV
jgi:hypothetical protein